LSFGAPREHAPDRPLRGRGRRVTPSLIEEPFMPLYESVFITRQDIPAQEVEALAERFQGIIAEHGGKVEKREYWGLKNLAYRIKKNRKGHYTLFQMDAPSDAVQEMERNMRISEDVLRYLTVRIAALDEGPSVMMQARQAREDRARRDDRRGRVAVDRTRTAEPKAAAEPKAKTAETKDTAAETKADAKAKTAETKDTAAETKDTAETEGKAEADTREPSAGETPSKDAE
jgi:small subunit ribosomal protein S6